MGPGGIMARRLALVAIGLAGLANPAAAQQPTKAQTDAIRQNCRSDFMLKCSGVTPGGADALQCLKKNVASLSPGCQGAVTAINGEAPAAAPAASTPAMPPAASAPPPPPPALAAKAPPAAAPPPPAASAAPPTIGPRAIKKELKKELKKDMRPAAAAPPAAPPPPAAAIAPPPPALSPEEEAALVRQSCAFDYRRLCRGTPIGGGRVIACLNAHGRALSPACQGAMKVVGRR